MDLIYVTGNYGKISRAKEQFKEQGINLEWFNHDCDEPEINDIQYISRHKALEAYSLVKKPCIVVDSGFYIDNYPGEPGFPGAFPKRAITDTDGGIEGVLEKMRGIDDRECRFVDCLTYYDGIDFKTFFGFSEGTLAYRKRGIKQVKAKSDLWYLFIPINHNKTLAEMTAKERNNRNDNRISAIEKFIEWYKPTINKPRKLSLEKN